MSTDNNILTCIDGSVYVDSTIAYAAWASKRLDAPVKLLHVQAPSTKHDDASSNLSGAIGLGVKSSLLEELTQLDEARGKLEQQKGKLILAHAKEHLAAIWGDEEPSREIETLHRRGSFVETLSELDDSVQMIVMGKRGENADFAKMHLGTHLERAARSTHKPLLIAARAFKPVNSFVLAYDGGPSTLKAVDYVINSPLLRGLECHLLKVGADTSANQSNLAEAVAKLEGAGFTVHASLQQGDADTVIADYVKSADIDMLLMGAYGHSRIRTLIIGSTTSSMLRSCLVPVLMFR